MKSIATPVRSIISCAALSLAVLVPQQLAAQTAGQSRNDLALPDTETPDEDRVDVRVDPDAQVRPDCPFDDSDLTVSLSSVNFNDARGGVLAPELAQSLSGISAPSGTSPISVICDIRDAANDALRKDGWIATIQVPQQELTDTLQLDVIAARISEIRITGDPGPYRDALTQALNPLRELDPLNERDAERILLLANDIPGLSVRLALAPSGTEPGAVIGNLTVDFERYAAFFNARNYNAKSIGRGTLYGRGEVYGLTGLSDITYVGVQTTGDFNEQIIVQGGHEFGIGAENIRVGAQVTQAWANPTIQNLDLETDTFLASFYARYPLIRTPKTSANVSLGFDLINQESTVGTVGLSKDAIRTLYLRGDVQGRMTRPNGSNRLFYSAFLELRQGLSVFGATGTDNNGFAATDGITASRPFGDATATVIRGGADLTYFIGDIFDVRTRVEGQWTDDPLLNYDEYSIGNLSIGRGYDPGANSGDRAIGFAGELGATVIDAADYRAKLIGFYDVIQLENLDPRTPEAVRTLESVGGGLRFSFGQGFDAEILYAKPLDRALFLDPERPPERLLFSVTTKFPALIR